MNLRKQRAITLIALVITIVILLILAGITINAIGGQNGLLAKAKWSAYVSEYESVAEAKELYKSEKMIEHLGETSDIYKVASTEVTKISSTNVENMYPIDKQQRIENSSISATLKNAIMQLEGLTEEEINNEEKVNLYKVDFSKINAEAKKEYVINIVNGNLYSLQYEEYNGKFYHTPRLGVSVVENSKITEPGIYEMVVDAGSVVSWDSIQIYYDEFVENSLTCKVYTSDDEINWTEESIETANRNELIEKYNIATVNDSQFLKIQVENREINGKNSKVDYIMVNFYKYKEIEIEPEVTVQGVEKQNGMYSISTPSNGQVEATGTGKVIQKINVPDDGEFLIEMEEVYGNPSTIIKITKPDGTEETIDMSETSTIKVPAGATVEVTTQLQAGDSIGDIKLLKKETELTSKKIENNTTSKAGWITVKQDKYMYNNGGAGFWEKCLVNNVEVDESGIIIESEDAVKRIRVRYQASDGITWSSTFSNIQDARNAQYLKVIVEYQVIEGNEYGDTNNNTIKIIINDGSWTATFVDEDGTELFNKYAYFENNLMQGSITLPKSTKAKEGRCLVGWKIGDNNYKVGESYTLTKDETFIAVYEDFKITATTPIINITTTATTSVEDNSQPKGTILYINFSATLNDGTECIIVNKDDNKVVPYEITKNGTYTFTATVIYNGETITEEIEVVVKKYQSAVGVVQYDAGVWTQEEIDALTNSKLYDYNEAHSRGDGTFKLLNDEGINFTFGGFKAGDSRNSSVSPESGYGTPKFDGWQVLESEERDGKIYITKLVHAGSSENFVIYYTTGSDCTRAEYLLSNGERQKDYSTLSNGTIINPRSWEMYKDKTLEAQGYIKDVHAMTADEVTLAEESVRGIGSYYWTSNSRDTYWDAMKYVDNWYNSVRQVNNTAYRCWGIRPVVSLEDGVYIASGTGVEGDPYILGKE